MSTKLTARKLATVAIAGVAFVPMSSAPLYAASDTLNCQYEGRPDSVVRSGPGFGVMFGMFRLVNSPSDCPNHITAIQFSGSSAADAASFVSTIETCLDMASLLVVVRNGLVTVDLHDPLTGEPGVVIGNGLPVVNSCRISKRARPHDEPDHESAEQ